MFFLTHQYHQHSAGIFRSENLRRTLNIYSRRSGRCKLIASALFIQTILYMKTAAGLKLPSALEIQKIKTRILSM